MTSPRTSRTVLRYRQQTPDCRQEPDEVVTEEPLEIRLVQGGEERSVALTMRTPGADEDLVLGLLHAEGAIHRAQDVLSFEVWREGEQVNPNVVRIQLRSGFQALRRLSRNSFTSSACGVCGTGNIEMLALRAAPARWNAPPLDPEVLSGLPGKLRDHQTLFESTGGLHGAALCDARGQLLAVREDIGRHNAVDKLIGWALREDLLPLSDHLLVVSSRAGFEISQKAALAGIPVIVAVSAPSSLAIEVAESFGQTLLGFVREGRFNVYCGAERLALTSSRAPAPNATSPP